MRIFRHRYTVDICKALCSADIFCAAGTLSESVPSDVILTAVRFPKWQPDAPNTRILFATDRSAVVIRPGHSLTFEEVEPLALQ